MRECLRMDTSMLVCCQRQCIYVSGSSSSAESLHSSSTGSPIGASACGWMHLCWFFAYVRLHGRTTCLRTSPPCYQRTAAAGADAAASPADPYRLVRTHVAYGMDARTTCLTTILTPLLLLLLMFSASPAQTWTGWWACAWPMAWTYAPLASPPCV
jgi:hypothetical protein